MEASLPHQLLDHGVDLDALDPDDELDTEQSAATLRKHPATLKRWRKERRFLPFLQIGGEVRYKVGDLRNFLAAARVEPIERQR
jgi:hypothetical protein